MDTHGDYGSHKSQNLCATWHPSLAILNPWEDLCSWMSQKANTLGHIPHISNWEGNVTYMGGEESNGRCLDTWARFPNIYDIYGTNDEDAMTFIKYCRIEG